jgi:hypothetical protein
MLRAVRQGFFCLVLLHGAVVTKADGSGLNLQYFVKRLEGGAWAVKEPHRGLTIEGAFAALGDRPAVHRRALPGIS